MRLGEWLVKEGQVAEEELATALEQQIINGGRLGTNLVEIGAISLDNFSKALAQYAKQPEVTIAHFEARHSLVSLRIDESIAESLKVIPLYQSGNFTNSVIVAGMDPMDSKTNKILQDIYGKHISVGVAPELRILYWLEQVFGIQRANRFKRIDSLSPKPKPASSKRDYVKAITGDEEISLTQKVARISVKRMTVQVKDGGIRSVALHDLSAVNRSIKRELSREDIADTTLSALQQHFEHKISTGLLLLRREHILECWQGFTMDQNSGSSPIEDIALSLEEESVFKTAFETRRDYTKGPLANPTPVDKRFQEAISSTTALDVSLFPLVMKDKNLGFLYVEGRSRFTDDDFVRLKELANSICTGFKRLINASKR